MRLLFLFFLTLFSCAAPAPKHQKPRILTSTPTYQYFVERIGENLIEAHSIVPPGADSHSFEPTPKQRASLAEGILWFQIGECFERSLTGISPKTKRINLCEGIENSSDRHFWMSPRLAMHQVSLITKALSKEFPEHKEKFQANEQNLLKELAALDTELKESLASAKNRTLLVSHPSFAYFCRDYSFEQLSVEQEGKDPRPKHLEALLKDSEKKHDSLVLIALPQHNNKGLYVIANRLHLPVKEIDPYTYDYFSMMHTLSEWVSHERD